MCEGWSASLLSTHFFLLTFIIHFASPLLYFILFLCCVLLVHVNLSGSIPPDIALLTSLQELNLDFNSITGTIPPSIGTCLTSLREIDLRSNSLTGTLPDSFRNLENLEELFLQKNDLTGTFDFVCDGLDIREQTQTGKRANLNANAVTDKGVSNFYADCLEEVECSCCTACCSDAEGCFDMT